MDRSVPEEDNNIHHQFIAFQRVNVLFLCEESPKGECVNNVRMAPSKQDGGLIVSTAGGEGGGGKTTQKVVGIIK